MAQRPTYQFKSGVKRFSSRSASSGIPPVGSYDLAAPHRTTQRPSSIFLNTARQPLAPPSDVPPPGAYALPSAISVPKPKPASSYVDVRTLSHLPYSYSRSLLLLDQNECNYMPTIVPCHTLETEQPRKATAKRRDVSLKKSIHTIDRIMSNLPQFDTAAQPETNEKLPGIRESAWLFGRNNVNIKVSDPLKGLTIKTVPEPRRDRKPHVVKRRPDPGRFHLYERLPLSGNETPGPGAYDPVLPPRHIQTPSMDLNARRARSKPTSWSAERARIAD